MLDEVMLSLFLYCVQTFITLCRRDSCVAYNFVSNRNSLVDEADNQVLQLDYPAGCVGKECALTARVNLDAVVGDMDLPPLEEATLQYKYVRHQAAHSLPDCICCVSSGMSVLFRCCTHMSPLLCAHMHRAFTWSQLYKHADSSFKRDSSFRRVASCQACVVAYAILVASRAMASLAGVHVTCGSSVQLPLSPSLAYHAV